MEFRGIDAAVQKITDALSFLPGGAVGPIILLLAVVIALLIHALLGRLIRRALGDQAALQRLVARTYALTRLAFITIAIVVVLPLVHLPADLTEILTAALRVIFVVLVGWIALIAVDIAAAVYLRSVRLDSEDNLLARKHVTQLRVLKRAISTIVILLTVGAALMTFDAVRQVGISLFASAGVAGIVAGLAARPVLANLIAGIQLAVTQPIRIEDAVIVENEFGSIEEITSSYVVVRLWDQRRMVVPLSYFIEKPFQNWSLEGSALLGAVLIYLDPTAPVDRIRGKAEEIVTASKLWDRSVVTVQVTDAKPNAIEVRVLVSAGDPGRLFDLRCEVREKLIAFIRDEFPTALPRNRQESFAAESAPRAGEGAASAEASRAASVKPRR
ncbi:MAG TPA: mechanosensitive ion channel family protein [Xanthobacteraceae bacterium]|nr:mechanosensitive ion channel family protein [Xanthobacteraceae bacterium]